MYKIDRFNIADVAMLHGIRTIREYGGETFAVCPFCGDERGKFSYFIRKKDKENLYHCWSCGVGGTAVDLHIKLSNRLEYNGADGYKLAIHDIFEGLNGDSSFGDHHMETNRKMSEKPIEADRASDEHCSAVYYAMLKLLRLEDMHRKDLERRGMSQKDIERFRFRSVPTDSRDICKALIKQGHSLEGVPGFFQGKHGNWIMALPGGKNDKGRWQTDTGYFCPVFDGDTNLILGFQIRIDHPKKDSGKYLWFSSSGKKSGVSSGSISSFLPGENPNVVIITEGILKAMVIYSLLGGKVSVCGIPGVKIYKSVTRYFDRFGLKGYAFEAYDMDKCFLNSDKGNLRIYKKNPDKLDEETRKRLKKTEGIANDAASLKSMIEDYNLPVHALKWDFDKDGLWNGTYKGLDDFLLSYGESEKFTNYLLKKAQPSLKMQEYLTKSIA